MERGVLGSIVSSSSGVRGIALARNAFWRNLKAIERSFLHLYADTSSSSNSVLCHIWGRGSRTRFGGIYSNAPFSTYMPILWVRQTVFRVTFGGGGKDEVWGAITPSFQLRTAPGMAQLSIIITFWNRVFFVHYFVCSSVKYTSVTCNLWRHQASGSIINDSCFQQYKSIKIEQETWKLQTKIKLYFSMNHSEEVLYTVIRRERTLIIISDLFLMMMFICSIDIQ